jgi:hypothetical protein
MAKSKFFEKSVSRGVLYGFVPSRLEIADRPELNDFPFNVLFMQFKIDNGKTISGSAIYEPDVGSYKVEGDASSMEYRNIYGPSDWLEIEYDSIKHSYTGKKTVNGESAGMAVGGDWKKFFIHFTGLGLTSGERCMFEEVPPHGN